MKEKKTNMFSFYFALLLRADGAVEASWWPHNRALLYANLPWIVAVYLLSFLAGRLYTILWKYAGERDLIRLAGMIAVPTGIVYLVNRCFIHGVLFNSANAMAAVLIFLFIGGSRLAWRLFLNHPLGGFCITARFQAAFYHIAIHIYYYKIVRSQFVIIHTRWLNND